MSTLPERTPLIGMPPIIQPPAAGWEAWGLHVLIELERLNNENKTNKDLIGTHTTQIALLQLKCGLVGLLCGMIPVSVLILVQYFSK